MPCRHFVVNFIEQQASGREQAILREFPADPLYVDLVAGLAATAMEGMDGSVIPTLALAGSQGTGKSTLAQALRHLLREQYGRQATILSLDDFYLTRAERHRLAEQVHPLLRTRGVPGTHDVTRLNDTLLALQRGDSADLPVFDKSRDDRAEATRFVVSTDVIICEGWCWGARPEPEESLRLPINDLEASEDVDGHWRRYVNHQLSGYQPLFCQDLLVYLRVPSMEQVFAWRWQQEQDLKKATGSTSTMDKDQVTQFIQFYERLTRWMLLDMPARSDLIAYLDDQHRVVKVERGTDSGSIQ